MSSTEQITYDDFLYTCKTNGLTHVVIARRKFIETIPFRSIPFVQLPCRSIEHGRELIKGFKEDGLEGEFYIKKLSFPEDSWFVKLKNWTIRYR
jgi:hypothetical protein